MTVIVFEEISPLYRWLIRWHWSRGREVRFLRMHPSVKKSKWILGNIASGRLKKVDFTYDKNTFSGMYYDMAFDNIDYFAGGSSESVIKRSAKLYENSNIELVYKKDLHKELSRFYFLNYFMHELSKIYGEKRIYFSPSNGIDVYRTDGCEVYDYFRFEKRAKEKGASLFDAGEVRFPFLSKALSYNKAILRQALTRIKISALLLWASGRAMFNGLAKTRAGGEYKYAIMISSPIRQFGNHIQKIDFLIDEDLIKKKDAVFVANNRLNKRHKEYLENNSLNYIDDVDRFVSWGEVKKVFPFCLSLLFRFKTTQEVMTSALKAAYFYVRWKAFTREVKIKRFITHADFGVQSIARNIVLSGSGTRTFYYMDSANFGCFFTPAGSETVQYRHNLFGFLFYDYFVGWNDKVIEYFKNCKCRIKEHINCGCFWAEHVRDIKEGRISSSFREKLAEYGYRDDLKLVSVFDSTFHDASVTTYDDGIQFLKGILRLLKEMPDIFVVIKEKKARHVHKRMSARALEVAETYAALESHPNCFCVKVAEDEWTNASEMIALSDLTISFPYTSTSFEAVSAGERALWYDASDKFRGTFYDEIPDLVCHDYRQLFVTVHRLLWETSEEEYNTFLSTHVKRALESHLDSKAISRFRDLLVSGHSEETEHPVYSVRR